MCAEQNMKSKGVENIANRTRTINTTSSSYIKNIGKWAENKKSAH
jgi:hypothetical protein